MLYLEIPHNGTYDKIRQVEHLLGIDWFLEIVGSKEFVYYQLPYVTES